MIEKGAPIFVVGAGRSGTTLLRLMLNEHPDIAIPSESHFIAPLIQEFGPTAILSGESIERALELVVECPEWERDFGHTPAELRAFVGTEPLSLAGFVERVFRLEVGPDPAHWGDKTPANLHWVGKLLEVFPDAQVVAIVRDPRDVYLSLVTLGWFGDTTWAIGRYLAQNGALVQNWIAKCPPAQFHVVRYEDLVVDTGATLRRLCDELGVPFVPAMAEFHERTQQHVQQWELDTGIHKKLLRPPASDDVARWRREGSRRDRAEIEAVTIDVIDAWNYERSIPSVWLPVLRAEARTRHHVKEPGALAARNVEQLRRRLRKLTNRPPVRPPAA
jgi:hypothetical protein